jgi:molybdopterin/thiamine biosynthesis adenylyltransferase
MNEPRLPANFAFQPRIEDNASVKLIGLGGVGSTVARYLALFLSSLHRELRLLLIDGDTFELSNATRMLFGDLGNKAEVLCEEIRPYVADTKLSVVGIDDYVTPENIDHMIQSGDTILLAVDNHATRRLFDDHVSRVRDICLISGGNDGAGKDSRGVYRRGTYGNVQVYVRRDGQDRTPALRSGHPEIAHPTDHLPSDPNCTELVASTPQILFANLAVASAMCSTFWLYLCGGLHYGEVAFDIADAVMRPLPLPAVQSLTAMGATAGANTPNG